AGETERLRGELAAAKERERREREEKEAARTERRRCEAELVKFSEATAELRSLVAKLRGDAQEEAGANMPDSIHQKNLTINQLKEENRRLISKLEIARKRMTAHGLATTDIDVNSDELSLVRRVERIVEELR
ncbi:hypothetical protein WA588_006550, partial [Blastocystis sp. NMH]